MLKGLVSGHCKGLLLHGHYFIQAQWPTGDLFSVALTTSFPQTSPNPKHFLLEVMNDPTIAMQLRIEAAKALLPYC
jgi:hypothetical protein